MTELQPIVNGRDDRTGRPLLMAGPCSAESREQVMSTAFGLKGSGAEVLRAGIWKPRTKPGCFEGVGAQGLAWLTEAGRETGMLTATEVANREHVAMALEAGIDILWIGARTTTNPFAVQEIADALRHAGASETPVLVKNPVNPDLELWIGAIERLYNAGLRRLGAIHRGFSTYGRGLYRNEPIWRVALDLRQRCPELPLICDPSHMGGRRDLVGPLSQQALDIGFDGLMIETHITPDDALSDSAQQVTPGQLKEIASRLKVRKTAIPSRGAKGEMARLRAQIDKLDNILVEALAQRMAVSREIGAYKSRHDIPVVQTGRFGDIISDRIALGSAMGLDGEFVRSIFSTIHEESVRQQLPATTQAESVKEA